MILVSIRKTENGYSAYRFTTNERGTIKPENLPPRVKREIAEKGRASFVIEKKFMEVSK